jgi:hypothetical protein
MVLVVTAVSFSVVRPRTGPSCAGYSGACRSAAFSARRRSIEKTGSTMRLSFFHMSVHIHLCFENQNPLIRQSWVRPLRLYELNAGPCVFAGFGHFSDGPRFFAAAGQAVEDFLGVFSGTTATSPIPLLKVRIISFSSTLPASCKKGKMGGMSQDPFFMAMPQAWGRTRMMLSMMPPPVMCASPWMGRSRTKDWMVSE